MASYGIDTVAHKAPASGNQRDLKLIIDTIPALAWSARPDGSAEFFSQYFDFIGFSGEQAGGWGWTAALHPDDAKELNQPLAGSITNAGTCLRMLNAEPPNMDGARETVRRTIRDGNRVSDVIGRLRALFSKREFTLEPVDLNDAMREVVALSAGDLERNRIVITSDLAHDLPAVPADRIQLQQVVLNLLRNASDAVVDVQDRPRRLQIARTTIGCASRSRTPAWACRRRARTRCSAPFTRPRPAAWESGCS